MCITHAVNTSVQFSGRQQSVEFVLPDELALRAKKDANKVTAGKYFDLIGPIMINDDRGMGIDV